MNAPVSFFSHAEIVSQFRDAMRAAGLNTSDQIIADGMLRRSHIEGDPRNKRNGFYKLYLDGHPAGMFGCWKRGGGEAIKWSMKGNKRLSTEERRELMAKMKADAAKRDAAKRMAFAAAAVRAHTIWARAAECSQHPYLARKGVQGRGLRVTEWVRDLPHDPETGEVRQVRIPSALLVPIRNSSKEIVSLQAIFPAKDEGLGRDKDFLPGGEKRGCWYAFGRNAENQAKPIILAEGYATAASLHEATGFACIVCFDAGNLQPVAETVRRLMPDAVIIIAADNDQFTEGNPGVSFATRAAKACGGHLAVPQFKDLDGKPTDFNDLHAREGIDAVLVHTTAVIVTDPPAPEPEASTDPEPDMPPEPPAEETEAEGKERQKAERKAKREAKVAAAAKRAEEYAANPDMYDPSKYFTMLGHDRTCIFVYSHEMKLVVSHAIDRWNKHTMLKIARPDFWKVFSANPEGNEPPDWDFCENWLISESYRKGYYDPSKTRGRGAWLDEGRVVYHFGNMLLVDGVETPVTAIKSEYIYEQGKRLPAPGDETMTAAEGKNLVEIAKMFRWTKPGSAILMAGWAALAPICGALKWRPHIWITGSAGSGKTTAMNDYLCILAAGTALFAQGNSTEAGIRQTMGCDALPLLFDESEQQDEKAIQRVQNIISFIRQGSSSSGARTYKGTVSGEGTYSTNNSMCALSSIGVNITNDADRDRLTILNLRSRRDNETTDRWPELKAELYGLGRDADLPARLMRRSIELLPITLKNIEVFADAASKKFGSQREGDQYGTLMAGAWSLVSDHLVTPEQAASMIDRYDWSEYVEHTETNDAESALNTVLSAKIRTPSGDLSVHEIICAAVGRPTEGVDIPKPAARALLKRHGLSIWPNKAGSQPDRLLIANQHQQLTHLMENTPFANDLRGHLLRHKGIKKHDTTTDFGGSKCKAVSIALGDILQDEQDETDSGHVDCPSEDAPF